MRKFAVMVSSLYLLAVVAAFVVMLITADDTPMSGIFLVMLTFPWSMVLTRAQDVLHVNSAGFNGLFLLAGGLVNGFIFYAVLSRISSRFQR
ncbi:MAG: hypothetical protein JRJ68_00080 [Deltaproteobacteria bacterium]|nr:hypothetical protein [Deltaproteobacteria bacterium]